MDFYEKWNRRWREHMQKNRIQMLYSCTPEQARFLTEASIVDVREGIGHSGYFLEVTFEQKEKSVVFRRGFDMKSYRNVWYLKRWVRTAYIEKLFESFPFREMLKEWKVLKSEKKKR